MTTYNHFLDTNIVLAMILPDDNSFNKSNKYFEDNNDDKYFSNSAYAEAKNVINKIRRTTLKIIKCIQQYLSENLINFNNLDDSILKIKNQFLNKYKQNEFPEGLKRERFENILSNFFEVNSTTINTIMLNDNENLLNEFKKEIISSFKNILSDLDGFLSKLNLITLTHSKSTVRILKKIGLHKSDAKLIEESYYLSTIYNTPVAFITFDDEILKFSNEILKLFDFNVCIFNPSDFISC